jgi:hypothetical protein
MSAKVSAPTHPVVITANRLTDGRAVWLTARNTWCERIAQAELFPAAEASAALATAQRDEARQIVIAPYATEADDTSHGPEPRLNRERIRAHGPSVLA